MTDREELRKETQLRAQVIRHHVVKALEAKGHKVKTGGFDFEPRINTIDDAWVDFTIKCQQSWGLHVTGKLTYSFGTYGRRKSFSEPKKGYDIDRIVAQLEQLTEQKHESDRVEKERAVIERQAMKEFAKIERKLKALGFWGRVDRAGKPTITREFETVDELAAFLHTVNWRHKEGKKETTQQGETK